MAREAVIGDTFAVIATSARVTVFLVISCRYVDSIPQSSSVIAGRVYHFELAGMSAVDVKNLFALYSNAFCLIKKRGYLQTRTPSLMKILTEHLTLPNGSANVTL